MSAVSTISLSGSTVAELFLGGTAPTNPIFNPPTSGAPDNSTGDGRGPATNVQLSDKVKATLARAKTDQALADRLQGLVEANRTGVSSSASSPVSDDSKIDKAFEQLSGGDAATDDAPTFSPVEPGRNFSNTLQAGGFSVSATANAGDGSYSIVINGPSGLSLYDKRFGQNGEAGGGSGFRPGMSGGEYQTGNVAYFTFTQNDAAAASVTTSSGTGTATASAVAARSASVTFAIDFTTGSIQMTQSEALVAATAQATQPASPLSILA